MKMPNENMYQDVWVKGTLRIKGKRDCEHGYLILKELAQRFKRPFTMLDIGANYGYFSTRLAEDFDCCCVAVEPESRFAEEFFELNNNPKVILLKHEFTPKSIKRLAQSEHFDIVLAYGVIHWLPMNPLDSLIAITDLGDHALIELPFEADARTVGRNKMGEFEKVPFANYPIVGYMKSHLVSGRRKVILVEEPKHTLTRKHVLNEQAINLHIQADYHRKYAIHSPKRPMTDWINGVNVMTLAAYNCTYPTFSHFKNCLLRMHVPEQHGDIRPWNIVFDGQTCTLIDEHDEWPTSNDQRDLGYLFKCNSWTDILHLSVNHAKLYNV